MVTCPEDDLILCVARTRLEAGRAERIRVLLREEMDWTYLVATAIRHRVASFLYWQLHKISPESIPEPWMIFLTDHLHKTARRNLYLTAELFKVLELFRAKGISAIPYKGPVLSALAYGNLALRQFVDLDIVINHRDIPIAHEVLVAQGYRLDFDLAAQSSAGRTPGQYLFFRHSDRSIVELHTELTMRFFPVPLDLERLGRRLQPVSLSGRDVQTFSLEDSICILCVHGSKHYWDRLIWICDVAELAQHPRGVNWEQAEEQARRLGCERMLFWGLYLTNHVLEASFPEELRRRVQASPVVRSLAGEAEGRLFNETRSRLGVAQRFFFRLRMREKPWDGIRYCFRLATSATEEDWSRVRLPRLLAPLYGVMRTLRLLRRYGLGLVRRTEPDLAPFVATRLEVVEHMLALGEVGPKDVLYDLGSGDGRIVVTAAKRFGIRAVGVDMDPRRIAEAEANARRHGVQHLVRFVCGDAKTVDLSEATVVTLCLTLAGNVKLRQMLREQLRPGTRIVSLDFEIPGWPADRIERYEDQSRLSSRLLYLWRISGPEERPAPQSVALEAD